jgi:hypothetical protein
MFIVPIYYKNFLKTIVHYAYHSPYFVTLHHSNTSTRALRVDLPRAQHDKFDADLRTSALLGTPSVQSVHNYYLFALKDGGRLAPMAAKLVDRLAILVVVRRFRCVGGTDSR